MVKSKHTQAVCLFFLLFVNNQNMKKLSLPFKIPDFTYMYKYLLIISLLSIVQYILKLFDFEYADAFFTTAFCVTLSFCFTKKVKIRVFKFILPLICASFLMCYYIFRKDIAIIFAEKFSSNAVTFGFFDTLLNTCSFFDFRNIVYDTSYGGAMLIDGNIKCGIIDIVNANKNSLLAPYLTGRILSVFAFAGVLSALSKNRKYNLIIIIIMLFTGNQTPGLMLLLFISPAFYFIALLFNFFSFFIAQVLSLKGGFDVSASIFEVVFSSGNAVYILCLGAMFCAVSYYFSRVVSERRK